ncbi:hypothetical protein TNCV_671771 [Trichonephila clavipes]|nr:hypothetical protein TNCV_671771 [Trichonephila clavipes]
MRSAHDENYKCLPQQSTGWAFETLEHSPYSLDLALSGFQLFGPLKEAFRGRRYVSKMNFRDVVQKWLQAN